MKTIATFMRNSNLFLLGLWVLQLARFTEAAPTVTNDYFAIHVVDADTGRGVPEGRPICRVWKVPGAVLTLDWIAKPMKVFPVDLNSRINKY